MYLEPIRFHWENLFDSQMLEGRGAGVKGLWQSCLLHVLILLEALRSLVIFLVRDRPVLDFVFSVQSCRKVDWWSIPGARFWGGRPSNGRSRTHGISGFIHPSGTSDGHPGSSVWSPGMPGWSLWSSRWRMIMCSRRCVINRPGLGVWSHTPVHPSLHESPLPGWRFSEETRTWDCWHQKPWKCLV